MYKVYYTSLDYKYNKNKTVDKFALEKNNIVRQSN